MQTESGVRRETRSRCGRGPTGDPTCRPSKIQALPYQILHEMKPIASTNPSPEAQISQLERIKWSVYGSDGDRQAARPRHTAQIRIVIPQTARAAHRTDPSIPASSRQSFHTDRSRGNIVTRTVGVNGTPANGSRLQPLREQMRNSRVAAIRNHMAGESHNVLSFPLRTMA